MKRILFNFLAGLSAVLCLAATGQWVRSHFVNDKTAWANPKFNVELFSSNGEIVTTLNRATANSPLNFRLGPSWALRYGWQGFYSEGSGNVRWTMAPHPLLAWIGIWTYSSTQLPDG